MERWWCLDCRTTVELDSHARCQICSSDAVDTMERTNMYLKATPEVSAPATDSYARGLVVHLGTVRVESGTEFPLTLSTVYVN